LLSWRILPLPYFRASEHQVGGADADRKFARLAIEEARKSISEDDNSPHPKVGAVVVKDHKGSAQRFVTNDPKIMLSISP
jgi:hypothetical protein